MRNKKAIQTYNRNQNRLAIRKARAMGTRKVNAGLRFAEPRANRVFYCGACGGPVVDDQVGRRRHGMKNEACKAAMEGGSE